MHANKGFLSRAPPRQVVRVLRAAQPKAFLLENVPNLERFNDGADLAALTDALQAAH